MIFSGLKKFRIYAHFSEKMNLLPQFFYRMVVIGLLSMVGDGTGVGVLHWEALGGRWEGVGRALGGRWRVVRVGSGSLIYRQIKSLHCSGYLLVDRNVDEIRIRSSFFTLF